MSIAGLTSTEQTTGIKAVFAVGTTPRRSLSSSINSTCVRRADTWHGEWCSVALKCRSFLFDCDDVALPTLKLDPDAELARVVPANVEVRQRAGLHDVECSCDNRF